MKSRQPEYFFAFRLPTYQKMFRNQGIPLMYSSRCLAKAFSLFKILRAKRARILQTALALTAKRELISVSVKPARMSRHKKMTFLPIRRYLF